MKASKLLLIAGWIALGCHGSRALAQGQIYFDNRVPGAVLAPVFRPSGLGAGAGATAQMWRVKEDGTLVPILPTTTFRTDFPDAAPYVMGRTLTVPGVPAPTFLDGEIRFTSAVFRMRVWVGTSWDDATFRGESNDITLPVGGDFFPPPNLEGLVGFTLFPRVTLALEVPQIAPLNRRTLVQSRMALLQTSLDLANWLDVGTVEVVGSTYSFDVFATEERRFYQVILLEGASPARPR